MDCRAYFFTAESKIVLLLVRSSSSVCMDVSRTVIKSSTALSKSEVAEMPSILEAALDKRMNASILSDEDNGSAGNIIECSCCGGREPKPDTVQWARTYYRQGQIYHPTRSEKAARES
mmetsp:Transcript_11428/g.20530  ORF Transcript_11428/g.20530 Transcript_11428/m.20530 type:complete len:118 (-) Transcript_11428:84-437(-)